MVKNKKKLKTNLIKFGEGLRKVAMTTATHPATFALMLIALDKTAVMINRSIGMRNDGSWRKKMFQKNNDTLAFLSDNIMTLDVAAAVAPVAVAGLGVVQAAVTKPQSGYP